MKEYKDKLLQFKEHLSKLSNQTIIDLKGILSDEIIEYQLKRTNSDIIVYLFEYGYEMLDLTFYGLDKYFQQYTEHISLPTKFPNKDSEFITSDDIYQFENKKAIKSYNNELTEHEKDLINAYHTEKTKIFESWFSNCWKKASIGIELTKDAYFSIHDTNCRIDLSTMKEISHTEIIKKLGLEE
ncbi:hypothetical protein [uncultured Winogradskyella sp.]|uniref:hypothetical protein n=1 Tax=uncultured Winogradskyella sp. TaxID=395353 RepID=UPI0026286471|nr:hypothetical protein [uncultured Winogradskyella sp.]